LKANDFDKAFQFIKTYQKLLLFNRTILKEEIKETKEEQDLSVDGLADDILQVGALIITRHPFRG